MLKCNELYQSDVDGEATPLKYRCRHRTKSSFLADTQSEVVLFTGVEYPYKTEHRRPERSVAA